MERIHDEQLQDLRRAAEDYLDSEIRLHESVRLYSSSIIRVITEVPET